MNNTNQDNRDFFNPSFNINTFLVTTKLFCCSLGIPLNLRIVKTIIRLLRLGYKSRHIFLKRLRFLFSHVRSSACRTDLLRNSAAGMLGICLRGVGRH
jgi:hypothetical protein